jgi:hypothetical protein
VVADHDGEAAVKWSDLFAWRRNRRLTRLYIAPRTYLTIPARLEADRAGIELMQQALRTAIGPPIRYPDPEIPVLAGLDPAIHALQGRGV